MSLAGDRPRQLRLPFSFLSPVGLIGLLIFLLCAVYLLAGTVGHDPWKSEDAIHLGIAHGFRGDGGWLIPRLAGEAWAADAPLYHWMAVATAWLTGWALPFHDGARLASALFGGALLLGLAAAGRTLHGEAAGRAAPLLAIGTLGLLVPIHDAQPAVAGLAFSALVFWGLALPATRPIAAGLLVGIGLGGSLLTGGLGTTLPLLPLLGLLAWQRRWTALAVSLISALATGGLWPALLAHQNPAHLSAWWLQQTALFREIVVPGADHLKLLVWFAWPVLPLALWSVWNHRRRLKTPELILPLAGTSAALAIYLGGEARPLDALPVLVPLILLALPGIERLRRGATNAFDWFGMTTFTLVAGLIWLGGLAMLTGWPPRIAHNFAKIEPGFVAQFSWPALITALAATLAWAGLLARLPRSPWRAATRWAAGTTLIWVLVVALWLPWIDYGKTYRPVAESLARALPKNPGCIERRGLGAPQRAMLDYHAGIRTRPESSRIDCGWLLVEEGPKKGSTPAGWTRVWEGHRPGDKTERLRLYRKSA